MFKDLCFIFKPTRFVYMGLVVSLSMTACSFRVEDNFSRNKIQVEEEKIIQETAYGDLSEDSLVGLAQHYNKHGDGPLTLTLTYDPKSRSHTAMTAGEKAAEFSEILRREGVRNVEANIMPVKDESEPRVIISYLGYNALAPKDCEVMPGLKGREVNANEDYKMGCSVDTYFARQIARPRDLLGQETSGSSDGRRGANQIEGYRTGIPNEPLGGESASGG